MEGLNFVINSPAALKYLFTSTEDGGNRDGIGPSWFSPNPTRTRRSSKPEPDLKLRPHKEARFGSTVVFPVH